MRHRSFGGRAVPVLLTRRTPDDVACSNHFDDALCSADEAPAGRDDQRLPERMRVPCGACARLEGDVSAEASRRRALNKGSMRTDPVNVSAGPVAEGCEPLRLMSMF